MCRKWNFFLSQDFTQRKSHFYLQAERVSVAKSLPPEPGLDSKEPICVLKCRMPAGKIISRRFLQSSTLKILFDFLFTEGYSKDTYKFLTSYPRRDVSTFQYN